MLVVVMQRVQIGRKERQGRGTRALECVVCAVVIQLCELDGLVAESLEAIFIILSFSCTNQRAVICRHAHMPCVCSF